MRSLPKCAPLSWMLTGALSLGLGAPLAWAHGGEDHAHEEPAVSPTLAPLPNVAAGEGSAFEVVLKTPPLVPGEPLRAQVFVSDRETNAPVEGATIDIEAKGADGFREVARAEVTPSPGVYALSLTPPGPGEFLFDVTVQAPPRADLLSLKGEFLAAEDAAPPSTPLGWPLLLAVGALTLGLGFGFGRLSRPAAP